MKILSCGLFVVVFLTSGLGSIADVNETSFNTWPRLYEIAAWADCQNPDTWPRLYEIDPWADCQNPGDVYCMVDAVLTGGSPLLRTLADYSSQILKHYNRSLIHRGVCLSRCGEVTGSETWEPAAQECVNRSIASNALQAEVISVDLCTVMHAPKQTSSAKALAIPCLALLVLVLLATIIHLLGEKCGKAEGNRFLLAFSLKRNWAILTYDRSKPRTEQRMADIACMEGIRVLGIQGVIFSHVLFIYLYSYTENPQFIEKMYDNFVWKYIFNSPVWLQAFFSLSGFLTAYSVLLVSEKSNFNWINGLLAIVTRYIRLTPVALFALWFTMAWFPLLGSGPQWSWLVEREARDCSDRWYYHMLYLHNYLPLGKLCMGHTWYLAVDMQLHVIGVMIMLVSVKYRQTLVPILTLLLVATSVASGLVVYLEQLTPIITAQSPEALRTMFADSKILSHLYLPVWTNLSGYVCGIVTGFILHHCQINGIKLNTSKWFNLVFHLAMPIGTGVVLAGVVFLADTPPPLWVAAVYSTLDRTLVAICFNVFMLGCFVKCKSGLRAMLDWRGFHTLGRLSYCAYIIHFIILRLSLASSTQLGHVSVTSMVSLLITTTVYTYLASIPICLVVELPLVQLWRALTEAQLHSRPDWSERASQPAQRAQPPPPTHHLTHKALDLVSHIHRRNIAQ